MGGSATPTDLGQFTAETPADVTINVNIAPESPIKDDVKPADDAAPEGDSGTQIAGDETPAEAAKTPEAA